MAAMASWRTLLWHLAVLPWSRARASTGSSRPASRAMMAMTTSSSIKVKACAGQAERRRCGWKAILISCETTNKKRADTPAYHNRVHESKRSVDQSQPRTMGGNDSILSRRFRPREYATTFYRASPRDARSNPGYHVSGLQPGKRLEIL